MEIIPPYHRRKVNGLNAILASGDIAAALSKLHSDIRPRVQEWLMDGCGGETALDVTKDELLELIDDAIERITAR